MPWCLVHVSQSQTRVGDSALLPNTWDTVPLVFTFTKDRPRGRVDMVAGDISINPVFLKSQSLPSSFGHTDILPVGSVLFCFLRFYLFSFRERGREGERERNISVWLPLTCPPMGTWPTTEPCALTGNRTGNPMVQRLALNPLSHTSQGCLFLLFIYYVDFHGLTSKKPSDLV